MRKLLLIIFLFSTIVSFGQVADTLKWQDPVTPGFKYNSLYVKKNFILPIVTRWAVDTTDKTPGNIKVIGDRLYFVGQDGHWYTSNIGGVVNELDPVFLAHVASSITNTNISNWNAAFGWGNHAGLYRPISYVPSWSEITGKPSFATVATTGSYNDLTNKPTITPSAWGQITGSISAQTDLQAALNLKANFQTMLDSLANVQQRINDSIAVLRTLANRADTVDIAMDNNAFTGNGVDTAFSPNMVWLAAHWVTNQTPTGTINGSNTSFTLANAPISGTLKVFLNGVRQKPGNDYNYSTGTSFSYIIPPPTGSSLIVEYIKP